jgi:DNA-binding YbaB/EbfC family protein
MGFNIAKMMEQAKAMQEKMAAQEAKKETKEIEGKAGTEDDNVKIVLDGRHLAKKISLNSSITKEMPSEDKEFLEDLILAAFNDASNKVHAENKLGMEGLGAGMDLGAFSKLMK